MNTRSVLISFPGYPFELSHLLPDRFLASMAACLQDAGHWTRVCDYATPEMMDYLFPPEARDTAARIADHLLAGDSMNPLVTCQMLWRVRVTDRAYRARHARVAERVADKLAANKHLDFVAVKVGTIDDFCSVTPIVTRLRARRPDLPIVGVGRFVEQYPDDVLKTVPSFNCVYVGEPECGLADFAEAVHTPASWPGISNLVFPGKGRIHHTRKVSARELNAAPTPAYDADTYPALARGGKLRLFVLEDSRGSQTGTARVRPAAAVCTELEGLFALYGVQAFHVSSPATPTEHVQAVAREIQARGLPAAYSRIAHAGFVDNGAVRSRVHRSVFSDLVNSGCLALTFQVDTGSQRLLDKHYERNVSVSQMERALLASKESGLHTTARLTYPCPGDDYHTQDETIRLVRRCRPHAAPVLSPEMSPESAWFAQPAAYGYALNPKTFFKRLVRCHTPFPLPRGRWSTLPFGIGQLSVSQVTAAQEELMQEVERHGAATSCPERLPLLARVIGHSGRLADFAAQIQKLFVEGNAAAVSDLVVNFNETACVPAHLRALRTFTRLRRAVGN